jgi:hypothetical protein
MVRMSGLTLSHASGDTRRRAIVVALLLAAVPWVVVAWKLEHAKPVAAPSVQPSAIVWADRVFTSSHALKVWLRDHGVSYNAWVAAHPRSAAIIDPKAAAALPTSTVATPPAAAPTPAAGSGSWSFPTGALLDVLGLLLAGGLLAIAVVPGRVFMLVRPNHPEPSPELRVSAFAAALSVVAGVFVGRIIG